MYACPKTCPFCSRNLYCERRDKINSFLRNSLLTEKQQKDIALYCDRDGTDFKEFTQLKEIENSADEFVKSGKNLFLHSSNCGNSKTSWAIKILKSYFVKSWARLSFGCHGLFISVPRFLLALKDNIDSHNEYAEFIKENVYDADVVVWDDIATKVGTEFELNHMLSIVDARLSAGKSNIYTSNLSKNDIARVLGMRLMSRICNSAVDIELFGSDKRWIERGDDK